MQPCKKRTPRHYGKTSPVLDVLFLAVIASQTVGQDSPRYGYFSARETLLRGISRQWRAKATGSPGFARCGRMSSVGSLLP